MRQPTSKKTGFTILELALAMAFISFLLLAIGFAIIQITRVYEKGITLKTVNENGRELIDEFSRVILASKYDLSEDTDGTHFEYTYVQVSGKVGEDVAAEDTPSTEVPLYGAFCTGTYSYLWNTGYALRTEETDTTSEESGELSYKKGSAYLELGEGSTFEGKTDYRLIRLNDSGREICINFAKDNKDNLDTFGNVFRAEKATNYTEILSPSESDLVLYDLTVFEPIYEAGTGHALFSASFILGTMNGGADITTSGDFCRRGPDALDTDSSYCSINKFNFAARATGGLAI